MKCWQILRVWPLLAQLALSIMVTSPALQARADSSVVVLGVRSLDGDDELARKVSQALREGAKLVPAWKISDRDVSLAQMSLAHGCEEPDARCMADIASTLEVDRLIYGTMLRRDSVIEVALFNFDAVTGQVESSISEKVPPDALEGVALTGTASGLAKRLAGIEATGALRVRGDAPGARVVLDTKEIGVLDAKGELLVAGIAVGKHMLSVIDPNGQAAQQVEIREAETTTAQALLGTSRPTATDDEDESDEALDQGPPGPKPERNMRRILGYSALGLAGAFAVATTYAWVRIGRINDSDDLNNYRDEFTKNDNVCNAARDKVLQMKNVNYAALENSAADLCDEADTLELLQYVFIGGALAAAGVGTYLLLTDKPKGARHSLMLEPRLARGRGGLTATLRF